MKDVSELVTLTIDYGTFQCLAEKLGETVAKSYYYTPYETEYRDAKLCTIGTGCPTIERLDQFMDPQILEEIDLFIFPDIGYGGLQKYLRSINKAVWGSMGASDLELYRTRFLTMLGEVGLPVAPSKICRGMKELETCLRTEKDKWVKLNRFRANCETFHHVDWEHSLPMINYLHDEFGGVCDKVVFVVQDPILDAQEVGYDGFSIDGQFPKQSFQGYEKKNELYLGSLLPAENMPEEVRRVNHALAPILKEYRYRNFIATEIRDKFFIDPTPRMAGQTQEHLLETMTNLPEVIWQGANGVLVEPDYSAKFAAEATLHYTGCDEDWKVLKLPETGREWFKFTAHVQDGDYLHFPPGKNNEVGVCVANADTIEGAIDALKANLELVKDEPLEARTEGFADLLTTIKKAQAEGAHFTDQTIPPPEIALET